MARLASLALIAALFAGCGAASRTSTPTPPVAQGDQTVSLTMTARQENKKVLISGTTDLPDGAVISYELTSDAPEFDSADGLATVSGGTYSAAPDVATWSSGNINVWVAFQTVLDTTHDQPQAVLDRYGRFGERLTGPNVSVAGAFKRVEIEITLELRGL